jgi:hypothetical protein
MAENRRRTESRDHEPIQDLVLRGFSDCAPQSCGGTPRIDAVLLHPERAIRSDVIARLDR